ncbi:cytochrome b [Allofrancisella guangzhouensis]|uniref:cytochrome b n=1 Tax=Allofrancisella guangzhouensis TaxID=594679 RepID=UPI0008528914|nr:cytochrome b/b6 domain-containing protein [Allofrancisella guangzhouensis]MBK2026586.1 cytochrome b [Allofrancisella guangzhouensis]MBK2044330.1 cytochrome b [Allofrancisella guangzhouensis]MBK2045573.1 cytochrome b [Allofrancisella guangzhouensis]
MHKKDHVKKLIIALHWLTVVLLILVFVSIEFRSAFGKNTVFYGFMKSSHFYIGFSILFLTTFRIILKQFIMSPRPGYGLLRKLLAKLVHGFLYFWLMAMPILGWCIISAKGTYSIPFGLPSLIDHMPKEYIGQLKNVHEYLAYIGLGIIFIHILVGLFNYLSTRDSISYSEAKVSQNTDKDKERVFKIK